METVVANLSGPYRTETLDGREYIVAPSVLLRDAVLNGSDGPIYYPPEENGRSPLDWNGMPIVVYHPLDDAGNHVSARQPAVLQKQGVGTVFNAAHGGELTAETWFDAEKTRRVSPKVYGDLRAGRPIELSTGLFLRKEPAPAGSVHNGATYTHVARDHKPDHLAVLPDQRGACSVSDGCGVGVVNALSSLSGEEACAALESGTLGGRTLSAAELDELEALCGPTANAAATDYLLLSRLHGLLAQPGEALTVDDARDGWVVYRQGDKSWKRRYTQAGDGTVTLDDGEPTEVRRIGHYYRKPPVKGETVMNREQLIGWLTTNCECWKGKAKVLGNAGDFSDDDLKRLHLNAAVVMVARNRKLLVANADTADTMAGVNWKALAKVLGVDIDPGTDPAGFLAAMNGKLDEVKTALSGGPAEDAIDKGADDATEPMPTGNRKAPVAVPVARPLTDNEWMASAPPKVRAAVANSLDIVARERSALVERIVTANAADDHQRAVLRPIYDAMELQQLRVIAAALPQRDDAPAQPSYFGAAGGPVGNAGQDDSDNTLPEITFNFEEHASPKLRQKQA